MTLAVKRLQYHSGNGTYRLSVPASVVEANEWKKNQILYLKNTKGVFTLTYHATDYTRKIKLQYQKSRKAYSLCIPARIIEHLQFKPHQLFTFQSTRGWVQYCPYEAGRLIGVAKKIKNTVNNLPKPQEVLK